MIFEVIDIKTGRKQKIYAITSVAFYIDCTRKVCISNINHKAWLKLPEAKIEK